MPSAAVASSLRSKGAEHSETGVLLVHGLCGSPTELRFVAQGLARSGHAVDCPILAGHGGGEAELSETTWQEWYASAEKALLSMSRQCGRVVVAGLSTGAVLALMLAARHPDKVSGLALYSPTFWLNGRKVPWYAGLFRLVRWRALARLFRFPAPADFGIKDERLRAFIKAAIASPGAAPLSMATPGVAAMERERLVAAVLPLLGDIRLPVLVVHPREDEYAHLSNAEHLQSALAGPVDLVVLEDSYHLVTIDRQRGLVLQRTLEFLARLRATADVRQMAA